MITQHLRKFTPILPQSCRTDWQQLFKDHTMPSDQLYPLDEKIGHPDLLVGREKEFQSFHKWISQIPGKVSKSRVILARRKSGKTVFMQRLFNQLWSANGAVIPFYFDIAEKEMWYPDFALQYYRSFATHYISFLERDASLVGKLLSIEKIRDYGISRSMEVLVEDVDAMITDKAGGLHDSLWLTAYSAPHRYAGLFDQRFLVMIDEFQNITQYVYPDPHFQTAPIESLAGSFHYHVESKIAPMLVTGSYIRWLINISSRYLEAGRLSEFFMSPYLTPESGLEAVYRYANACQEPISDETAVQINTLCMADPFFISCVIQGEFEGKDLTTPDGVVEAVNHQVTWRYSEMSRTWREYIALTLQKINDRHAKNLLLFLNKHADRYWTPQELKTALNLELDIHEIQHKLMVLVEADMLEWGNADIDFRGLQDGTLHLILRSRFEKEITNFEPDLKQEFHEQISRLKQDRNRIQGQLNQLRGQVAELVLANALRSRKRFRLDTFFHCARAQSNESDHRCRELEPLHLNMVNVQTRVMMQRKDGKSMELDVLAESVCGRVLVVEVKKRKTRTGVDLIDDFLEKVHVYQQQHPDVTVIAAFLSLGGFTAEAAARCCEQGVLTGDTVGTGLSISSVPL